MTVLRICESKKLICKRIKGLTENVRESESACECECGRVCVYVCGQERVRTRAGQITGRNGIKWFDFY